MTNVLTFQPRPDATGKPDLVSNLDYLYAQAVKARRSVAGARSLDLCLRHYGEWLRRYYEIDGGVKGAFVALEKELRTFGAEIDNDRLDELVERLANVESSVKGALPWLSLPDFRRVKITAGEELKRSVGEIERAIAAAKSIGQRASLIRPKGAA